MIKEYLLKKVLDASINVAKRVLRKSGSKLLTVTNDIEESLAYHLQAVKNWSSEVTFTDLKKAKYTTDIFIELDLFVYPRRVRIHNDETIKSLPLKDIFDDSTGHIVLLGQPGA